MSAVPLSPCLGFQRSPLVSLPATATIVHWRAATWRTVARFYELHSAARAFPFCNFGFSGKTSSVPPIRVLTCVLFPLLPFYLPYLAVCTICKGRMLPRFRFSYILYRERNIEPLVRRGSLPPPLTPASLDWFLLRPKSLIFRRALELAHYLLVSGRDNVSGPAGGFCHQKA